MFIGVILRRLYAGVVLSSRKCSIVTAGGLYFCVRYGNRCGPSAINTSIKTTNEKLKLGHTVVDAMIRINYWLCRDHKATLNGLRMQDSQHYLEQMHINMQML